MSSIHNLQRASRLASQPNVRGTIIGGTYLRAPLSPIPAPLVQPPMVYWEGARGISYEFSLHTIGWQFLDVPGVYIACRQLLSGHWRAIYIGEAVSLKSRLNNLGGHERYACMMAHLATHLCVGLVEGGLLVRETIETDLRHAHSPPCNRQ